VKKNIVFLLALLVLPYLWVLGVSETGKWKIEARVLSCGFSNSSQRKRKHFDSSGGIFGQRVDSVVFLCGNFQGKTVSGY